LFEVFYKCSSFSKNSQTYLFYILEQRKSAERIAFISCDLESKNNLYFLSKAGETKIE
jgi:hypothetical protein